MTILGPAKSIRKGSEKEESGPLWKTKKKKNNDKIQK